MFLTRLKVDGVSAMPSLLSSLVAPPLGIDVAKGATDEGGPGVRKDGNYYAYVRDLDGNKIAAKSILT